MLIKWLGHYENYENWQNAKIDVSCGDILVNYHTNSLFESRAEVLYNGTLLEIYRGSNNYSKRWNNIYEWKTFLIESGMMGNIEIIKKKSVLKSYLSFLLLKK